MLDAVAFGAVQELGAVSRAGGTTSSARAVCKLGKTAKGSPSALDCSRAQEKGP